MGSLGSNHKDEEQSKLLTPETAKAYCSWVEWQPQEKARVFFKQKEKKAFNSSKSRGEREKSQQRDQEKEFPSGSGRLRIQHWHGCGPGSIPGPRTSTCHGCGRKKKKKKRTRNQVGSRWGHWGWSLVLSLGLRITKMGSVVGGDPSPKPSMVIWLRAI